MIENHSSRNKSIILKVAQNGKDFVGLKITKDTREIIFPMGYSLEQESSESKIITKNERKQILNLIKSIYLCTSNKKGERTSIIDGKEQNDFPLKAMFYIIEDFLDRNTYYTEKETLYTRAAGGKINWNRTIKNIKPVISESGIAFLNFIIRKNRIQENQLITELHKYCVYKSFEFFGFIYTSLLPEKGIIEENDILKNRKYYLQFLQEKIDTTFLESNNELFTNMYEIISNLDSENDTNDACYGTYCYQVVWEKMIDKFYGNINQYIKEKFFYPSSKWILKDGTKKINAPLRPDTIFLNNKNCFIIDSKYYSYTMLHEFTIEEDEQNTILVHGSIPGTDSIQKQITYAQYLDIDIKTNNYEKRKDYLFSHKNIFNLFILPSENKNKNLVYIGKGFSDWNDGTKNYHTIHLLTLDTKFLMENYKTKSKNEQENLIKTILENNNNG